MRKLLVLSVSILTVMLFSTKNVAAQNYNAAFSANIGASMGVGVKKFVSRSSALDFGFDYNLKCNAPMFSVTYQYYVPIVSELSLYLGAGANVGAVHVGRKHYGTEFAIGLHPNVGFEYKISGVPLALAIDYKPFLNFSAHSQVNNVGLKVLYTF